MRFQGMRVRAVSLVLALSALVVTATAMADNSVCKVGAQVTDRQKRTGTVVESKGADCRVRLADGTAHYYLAWMLTAGGSDSPRNAAVAPQRGTYACMAAGGIAGTLQLVIKSDSKYADGANSTGDYAFDAATGKLAFQSGPWKGYYGKVFSSRKIGLSSRDSGYYGTVCDLK